MRSVKFDLIKEDLRKISTGAFVALSGALATYFETGIFNDVDFGQYLALMTAFNSVLANTIRKFISETIYK